MKFFANENLYDPIIFFLKSDGSDVLSVRHDGMSLSDYSYLNASMGFILAAFLAG